MEKKITFTNSKGTKLAGLLHESKKGKNGLMLVMAHGFTSSKESNHFTALVPQLDALAVSTLRFDFSGHGESEGKFEDITLSQATNDILSAIQYAMSLGYSHIGLIGSSFGGCASILVASVSTDLTFVIFKCPVSDYLAVEYAVHGQKEMEEWKERGYIEEKRLDKTLRLNYTFIEDIKKHDFYGSAEKIAIPTLLIHGTADDEVPFEQSVELAKHLKNVQLVPVEGCDHWYTQQKDARTLYKEVLKFIRMF